MKKHKPFQVFLSLLPMVILLTTLTVSAVEIYPDSPEWNSDDKNVGGAAFISSANPRSGNASLKLRLSDSDKNGPMNDWAFYERYAEDTQEGWGFLSQITDLSFDWYRHTGLNSNYLAYDPWNVQTPVLRLFIKDTDSFSELVWERYYTNGSPLTQNELGNWVTQDLMNQNFWRRIDGKGYTVTSGTDLEIFSPNPLMALTPSNWADSISVSNVDIVTKYSESAFIYGISVGVGSQWPGPYIGYVDNIFLAFNNGEPVLNDNFELREVHPVPEPTTLLLLGSGMAVMGAGRRWRAKSKRC